MGRNGLAHAYKDTLEEAVTEGSSNLLPCRTGPYTVQSAAESSVTIYNDGVAILMSADRLIEMPKGPNDTKPYVRLQKFTSYSEQGMRKEKEGKTLPRQIQTTRRSRTRLLAESSDTATQEIRWSTESDTPQKTVEENTYERA